MTVKDEINKAFNKSASTYEKAAIIQLEIGERLFERLHYLKITPQYILDLGCGPGHFSKKLAALYPKAHIIGVDLAISMLQQAKKKHSWRRRWGVVGADMSHLPFPSGLFDLVFANQAVHWSGALEPLFREVNRVMRADGCFLFTTLGPYTFKELIQAWSFHEFAHVNSFTDMHDIGDMLMGARFLEPVVDMECITLHYKNFQDLLSALKTQGVVNINPQKNKGLTGKKAWQQFTNNYLAQRTGEGRCPLTYEVIYGQGWKGLPRAANQPTETYIPLSQIRRRP